jgi:hypothetical protein
MLEKMMGVGMYAGLGTTSEVVTKTDDTDSRAPTFKIL